MDWRFGLGSDLLGNLQGTFDAAAAGNAGVGLGEIRTEQTVPTDAIRVLTPVSNPGVGAQFGSFWEGVQGVLGSVAQIELQRYAQKRTTLAPQGAEPAAPAAPAASTGPKASTLLLIGGGVLAVGLVAFMALRK